MPSKSKQCQCGASVGPRSIMYCDYHAGYHAGHSVATMQAKRAANPEYREDERKKVKKRMRRLRAERAAISGEVIR